ncbi:MAG: hypothetical protein ACYSSP_08360, partial [Planctomycetota bacterium]
MLLLAGTLGLILLGIATIYAVGNPAESSESALASGNSSLWKKQAVFAGLSVLAFIGVNLFHYRSLGSISYWIYAFVLVLLAVLLF